MIALVLLAGCSESTGETTPLPQTTPETTPISTPEPTATPTPSPTPKAEFSDSGIEINYLDNLSSEEIERSIRGKAFQSYSYYMAAGWGDLFCFTPQGNEYYWFVSSMEETPSRIRAEYGTWELDRLGFITFTALKLIEWVGGSWIDGRPSYRFDLFGYDEVLTEIHIEDWTNFRVFTDDRGEVGFRVWGQEYFCTPVSDVKTDFERYFSLFER
jgi:hypothetical protein